jgi:23S rRNA (uracil1939-C5)-methyltransferase
VKSGETAHVAFESLTPEGDGVAQLESRELLCRGVFPGERADVRILSIARQQPRAYGRLVQLTTAHPGRRRAPCKNQESNSGRCAGCALMELDEVAQREAKRALLQRFGLEVAHFEPAPQPFGYRYSSKRIAFSWRGVLTLGSFAHDSHKPAAMPGCLVDHALLVRAFDCVEQRAESLGIRAYDERTGLGDLRFVWAKTNGTEVIVTLVAGREHSRVGELASLLGPEIAGVLLSVQAAQSNALRGQAATLIAGKSEVSLELLGQQLEVGALGFVQPNPQVAELAYRALTELDTLPGGERALAFDLYAGAGLTTRVLQASFAEVIACESHPESARALGIESERVESFLARELARAERRVPDLAIANPPRKGLGDEVCRQLLELGAPNLRVMSCGPEALARDLDRLSQRYQLLSLEAFDTLPQTPHLELVAKLRLR